GGLTIYLGIKNSEPPLNDVRVRQALSLALNRDAYTQSLLHGFGTPTGTGVLPTGGMATQRPTAKTCVWVGLRWRRSTGPGPRG
ncbi:hypothetical protein KC218_26465, partial [Mycobacterium tuberculosis]|nr:hypothetical protein [Mycobacterium tuberculosis]